MSSSENVRYLKNSFTTIKHLLKPFRKLKKGYSRNLHGFFDDIETFLQRLYDVINFLDSENKEPTREDVSNFLKRQRDRQTCEGVLPCRKRCDAPSQRSFPRGREPRPQRPRELGDTLL